MRFSLIVATVDRVAEPRALLNDLCAQTAKEFEVILVDQNDDDRLVSVVEAFASLLTLRHIRSSVRNNSHARNIGLQAAVGELVAFPDDDCLYPPDLLAAVDQAFRTDPGLTFLTGPSLSHEGRLGSGRWNHVSGPITMRNVWTSVTEFNFFLRADAARKVGGFDDLFGLGARFGSAEGVDMVLRLMRQGGRGYYNFDLKVLHPDKGMTPFTVARAFRYGTGLGRVLRKHRVSAGTVLTFFIRPVGGALVNLSKRRWIGCQFHLQTLRGRLYGFFSASGNPTD
jgi:glycosyltransferase involved in cell wall biosynthesis